ncbi:MAG: PaaI family thioesterase [Desulfobacteraceae bacterium]|nr:PaaI family thioesterase [Desulfobacteraceae bacterium]
MKNEIKNPFSDNNCFFCGSENKLGLKLKFFWNEDKKEIYTEYLPVRQFTGQGNILHGAIQMGLLDEIMGWNSYVFTQEMAVTSDINIKFLHPTYICGEKIKITCQVMSKKGPKLNMQATLSNIDGIKCTIATGTYHILPADKYNNIIQGKG